MPSTTELLPPPTQTFNPEERIVIIDFISQLAGVIAARYGEIGVPTEVVRYDAITPEHMERFSDPKRTKGFWLAGSKHNVNGPGAPQVPAEIIEINEKLGTPIMASCYGGQALAVALGGTVENGAKHELGRTKVDILGGAFFLDDTKVEDMLMSHKQVVTVVPVEADITATSPVGIAGWEIIRRKIFAQQGHVEAPLTTHGKRFFLQFAEICNITPSQEAADNYIEDILSQSDAEILQKAQDGFIQVFLSGGVDSSVGAERTFRILKAAGLEHKARFSYIDTGTMRDNDLASIAELIAHGLPIQIFDESELFINTEITLTDEEAKREKLVNPVLPSLENAESAHQVRLISRYAFLRVHQREAQKIRDEFGADIKVFLLMGTNAADIAESEAEIKAHHNQGIEESTDGVILPLKFLFKGQIRQAGEKAGLSESIYKRQPFPGPAESIRVVPSIPEFRLGTRAFTEAEDALHEYGSNSLRDFNFTMTPDRTRAVRGDEGSDGYSVILSPKNGIIPWSEMADISRELGNEVIQIGRVGIAPLGFDAGIPRRHVGIRRTKEMFALLRQIETTKDNWLLEQGFEEELSQHFMALTDSSLTAGKPETTAWLRLFQSGGWGKSNEDMMTGIVPFPGVNGFKDFDRDLKVLANMMMKAYKIGGFVFDITEKPFGTVERI
ncbi:MAG: guaA [Candidatus Saccharibacteria bacterium]|nr:guaA [Candidatus Saccharibacteria bacterium]